MMVHSLLISKLQIKSETNYFKLHISNLDFFSSIILNSIMKRKTFVYLILASFNFIYLSPTQAQDRLCADGQRSYFDVCPEDSKPGLIQNDKTPKQITKEINSVSTSTESQDTSSSLCRVGDRSEFFFPDDQQWYPGKVIGVKPNQCKVAYDGYGSEDDEWVGPERMRLLVLWTDGKKYSAKVIYKKGNRYMVTYEGYDSSDDELVDLSQLSIKTK